MKYALLFLFLTTVLLGVFGIVFSASHIYHFTSTLEYEPLIPPLYSLGLQFMFVPLVIFCAYGSFGCLSRWLQEKR